MLDTQAIESITGLKGQTTGDVLKLSVPRKEVRVTLEGFEIVPFMGLTSWVAFREGPHHTRAELPPGESRVKGSRRNSSGRDCQRSDARRRTTGRAGGLPGYRSSGGHAAPNTLPSGSAQNVFTGPIVELVPEPPFGDRVRVVLGTTPPVVAEVTARAVDALGLREGTRVYASVKATAPRTFK